jgi:hypothetical protein
MDLKDQRKKERNDTGEGKVSTKKNNKGSR